jgi:chromosomal replication initiator protein
VTVINGSVWDRVQERLRDLVPGKSFNTWIRPMSLLAVDGGELVLGVPHSFYKDWVDEHFRTLIETCAETELGCKVKVGFTIQQQSAEPERSPEPASVRPRLRHVTGLNHRHTFETFVVGPSNQFAQAAALAVAERPGKAYNPLFVYGGVGLGKTHILHAIGAHVLAANPDTRVFYTTGEIFMIEMINAIQRGRTLEFKRKFRGMDVLLIDDIHFLAKKDSTQEEFFHTFNALHEAHKQIVIASDRPPKELDGLEDRLISRFGWGLVTDIQPPDLETRVAILKKHAELKDTPLRDDVAMLIAQNIKTNIRELEGCLTRLFAEARNANRQVDVPFAEQVLSDLFRGQRRAVGSRRIIEVVAQVYELETETLCGKKRTNAIALPRQVAMFLLRKHTGKSFADIGQELGGRDHTTVMHGCAKIQRLLAADHELRAQLLEIAQVLGVSATN